MRQRSVRTVRTLGVSQGSVATQFRCGGIFNNHFIHCKLSTECASERIFKIGQYLANIWTKVYGGIFLTHGVYDSDTNFEVKRLFIFNRLAMVLPDDMPTDQTLSRMLHDDVNVLFFTLILTLFDNRRHNENSTLACSYRFQNYKLTY